MLAQKRSRSLAPTIPTTNGGGTNISPSAEEASAASGKLCHELSSSLQTLLLNIKNNDANSSTQDDVYHQFLNSPPQNSPKNNSNSNDSNSSSNIKSPTSVAATTLRRNGQQWLTTAMEKVGVNSTQNIHTFWKKFGYGNEEEFMDGRYLVWFVKEILLGCSLGSEGGSGSGSGSGGVNAGGDGEVQSDDVNEQLRVRVLSVLEQWDDSIASLLNKNGAKCMLDTDVEGEEADDEETAGVMWQMLLQNAHLTPETLRECLEAYTSPQQEYEMGLQTKRRSASGEEGEDDEDALPSEYFMYPSFFRHAVLHAKEQHDAHYNATANGGRNNKRRKSNHPSNGNAYYFPTTTTTTASTQQKSFNGVKKNTDHLPLLGYAIAHALLSTSFSSNSNNNNGNSSSSDGTMTIQQKVSHLKSSALITNLPQLLNICQHDYPTKNALYSGIAACVLDEVGEWIVLDGLLLAESTSSSNSDSNSGSGSGVGLGGEDCEQGMNACVCEQMRANVESIVDLFLVGNGVIDKLAKLTKTPLPNFVAEIADVLLNYSEVHHRLRLGPMARQDNNTSLAAATLLKQHLATDAKHIVHFIDTSNPGLKQCLMRKKFTGAAYYSGGAVVEDYEEDVDIIIPCNPIVVWIRACLLAGGEQQKNGDTSISGSSRSRGSNGLVSLSSSGCGLPAVAKTCLTLEDCTGIADTTKQHCWLLLFERMQDEDVLFEYGWDTTSGGATLANITMGAIGLQCALDYLKNVVLEAKETLLGNSQSRTPLGIGGGGRFSSRKSRNHQQHAEQDLLCVKDAVRRTALKILAPRPYTPHEALHIATQLSDAANPPKLEHTTWGVNNRATGGSKGSTAMDVACRILAAPSLYSVWIESLEQQEEEVFEEDDLDDVVEGGVQEEQVEEIAVEQPQIAPAGPQGELMSEEQPQMEDFDDAEPEPAVAAQEPVAKEQDNEVIDLGDTDDEGEVPNETSAELDVASPEEGDDSDQTKSIGSEADQLQAYTGEGDDASFGVPQEDETYPRHYHQFPGNYSGSDDYSAEDDEEEDRHLAYEGQYDEDEGRGESEDEEGHAPARPQGEENECVELLESSEEEEEVEQQEESGEERNETDILNDKVDQYITEHDDNNDQSALAEAEAASANESEERQNNEARILSEAVHDYTLARQVGHLEDPGQDEQEEDEGDDTLQIPLPVDGESDQEEREEQEVASEGAQESDAGSEAVAEPVPALPAVQGTVQEPIDLGGDDDEEMNEDEAEAPASKSTASDQSPAACDHQSDVDVVSEEREFPPPSAKDSDDEDEVEVVNETTDSALEVDHTIGKENPEEAESMERVIKTNSAETIEAAKECDEEENANHHPLEDSLVDDQAEEMDDGILYSSDSDNLDTDVNMADDEHESIDTEDDKRSLNEEVPQGETFDDTEETPSFEPPNAYGSGEEEEVNATNQPSVLVAAAMSSQRQGNVQSAASNHGQINMPHPSEPAIDGESYGNTSAAMESATDNANLWDNFDEASQGDGNDDNADGSNIQVVARYHGQNLALESVVDKRADADDTEEESSPEDSKAGDGEDDGQVLTDDGYVPDAEVSEVEPLDTKTHRDRDGVETVEQQPMDTAAPEKVEEPTKSVEENAAVEQISEVKASTEEGAEEDGHQDASVEEDDAQGGKEEGGLINAELMGSGVEGEDVEEDRELGSSFDEVGDSELEPDECDDLPIGADASDASEDGHQDASVEEDDANGEKEEGGLINAELMGSGVECEDGKEDRKLGSSFDEEGDRELEPDECDDLPIGADASDDTASKRSPNASENLNKSIEETAESTKEASVRQATAPEASHLADQQGANDSDDSSASPDETGDITSPTKISKKELRAQGKAKAKAWHDARSSKSPIKEPALARSDTNDASNTDASDDGGDANLEESEQGNGEGKATDEETASPKEESKEEPIDASLTARSKEAVNDDQQQEGSEEEKAVDREEVNGTDAAEDEVAENQHVMKSEGGEESELGNDAADIIAAESHPNEREQRELEEIHDMKVVDLKAELKKVGLPVGGRKRELQGRLTSHLYPHLHPDVIDTVIGEDNALVASKSSKKRKASSSVAGSKSKQGRKPSSKIDEQQETPISEMTHQDDSDFDDDSVQEQHFAGESGASKRSKKSPGIPLSIVTQKAKGASLPVVPEGEVVEGSTIGLAAVADLESEEKPPARAKRGSTRQSQKKEEDSNDDESTASNDTPSVASSTRRVSKRRATASAKDDASSVASDSSKRAKRSTRAKGAIEEESDAIEEEAKEEAPPKKSRPGRPKKAKADNDEGSVTSSTRQRSTRSSRNTQAKKAEGDVDEGSVTSRRSSRSAAAKKGADESVATRRSTRSRAKKQG